MIKSLKIDSLSPEDINDLFLALCKKVLKMKPDEVKTKVFGLTGSKKEMDNFKPTLAHIGQMITDFDMAVELKVSYTASEDAPEIKEPKPVVSETAKALDDQTKKIDDPELKNPVIENKNPVEEVKAPVDVNKIPPPPFG